MNRAEACAAVGVTEAQAERLFAKHGIVTRAEKDGWLARVVVLKCIVEETGCTLPQADARLRKMAREEGLS